MSRRLLSLVAGPRTSLASSRLLATTHARWMPPPKHYDSQFGDYPELPWTAFDNRSPYVHWDDPLRRRNFGETIPEEFDIQDGWFPGDFSNPLEHFKDALKGQLAIAVIIAGFMGLAWLTYDPKNKPPKREYPPEVIEHMQAGGLDRIVKRPYETPRLPVAEYAVPAAIKLPGDAHHH